MQFKAMAPIDNTEGEAVKEVRLEQDTNGDVNLLIGDNYVLTLSAADHRINLVGWCSEEATGMDVDEDGCVHVFFSGVQLFPKKGKW